VELLRQLASSGRAIITTIHQPSSNIFRQLDAVLLLSQVGGLVLSWAGLRSLDCCGCGCVIRALGPLPCLPQQQQQQPERP
jgi:hypothetical protein